MSAKETSDVSNTHSNEDIENTRTSEAIEYNNNSLYSITRKTSGFGDYPDLISEETPPSAVLDIVSDSDLLLTETSIGTAFIEGEETEIMVVTPPLTQSPQTSSTAVTVTEPISDENETSGTTTTTAPSEEQNEPNTGILLEPGRSRTLLCSSFLDNKIAQTPIISSHQTERTLQDNQNFVSPSPILNEEDGKGNGEEPSTSSKGAPTESTDSSEKHEQEEQISKQVIKTENEVPSIANGKQDEPNFVENSLESGAVTAPEAEHHPNKHEFVEDNSMHMAENIVKSDNFQAIHVDELLSQQQQQQQNHQKSISLDKIPSITVTATKSSHVSRIPSLKSVDKRNRNASSSSMSFEREPSTKTSRGRSNERKEKQRESTVSNSSKSRSKPRKQSNSNDAARNTSKSPIRVVEVFERTTPVQVKPTKPGKPISPYMCKVIPLEELDQGPRPSTKMVVNTKQRKILDKELSRSLEKEKFELVEALTEYYNKQPQSDDENTTPSLTDVVDDDESIISDGSTRETFMSWIMKEKSRDANHGGESNAAGGGGGYWNPMANVFRKNRSTQVSHRPSSSACQNTQESSADNGVNKDNLKHITTFPRIRLVGQDNDNEISYAGQRMYQSLKSLQKAIHLSDLFCFRNNAPDLPLGESLSQPVFQKFMESENEIEVLENITSLLGNARDNVMDYLESLQKANLVTDVGLTKMENGNNKDLNNVDKEDARTSKLIPDYLEKDNQIVLFTCPSCQSQMDLEIRNPPRTSSRERILPKVFTFLGDQTKVTLSIFYTWDSKSLVQTVACDGHRYQTHFSATDPCGPLQGILKADKEYIGQPTHLNLEILLSTIHRCASYIDTRIACSCVWTRQSKRYLLQLIERYLEKENKPSTTMSRWKLYIMERKLKKINVFAGIMRDFSGELVEAVNKLHFCMQKSCVLLNKNLREPELPGFGIDSTSSSWEEIKLDSETPYDACFPQASANGFYNINDMSFSVEDLYERLRTTTPDKEDIPKEIISVRTLMQIVALAAKDIDMACNLGEQYTASVKMPGKKGRRALQFMNITMSQLGFTKDVHFASLIATFLSVVDKLPLFEEFMCEQKVEVRAKVHKMCLKIIRKLYDLRANLCMQLNWSINLARNSFMRIKELNEIKRLKRLKTVKGEEGINEEIEFLGGSDGSLRASVY